MNRRATLALVTNSKTAPGTLMDLNRCLSVYMIISKLLTCVAVLIFTGFSTDMVEDILVMRSQDTTLLEITIFCVRALIVGVLLQNICVNALGLYGCLTANRYLLSYYGFYLVLMMVWFVCGCIIAVNRDQEDHKLTALFKKFNNSAKVKAAVDVYQAKRECCGSSYHSYEDGKYPVSCCPQNSSEANDRDNAEFAVNATCLKENAFQKKCENKQTTLLSSLQDTNMVEAFTIIMSCTFVVGGLEALFAFHMVHLINEENFDDVFGNL